MEKSNQTITCFGLDSNLDAVYYCRAAWRFHASSLLVRGSSRCESERLGKNTPRIDRGYRTREPLTAGGSYARMPGQWAHSSV